MDISDRIERYQAAASRAAAWLIDRQESDGSVSSIDDGVQPYHKVPYAWSLTGYDEPANKLLDWIASHGITKHGDLTGKKGPVACGWYDKFYTCANSWIVLAAARLGQLDFAHRCVDYILRQLDIKSGGIYSAPIPQPGQPRRQDIVSTSKAGSACLSTSRIKEAVLMGDWFV